MTGAQDVLDYIDAAYARLRSFGITENDRPERWGTDDAAREWWEAIGRRDAAMGRQRGWMVRWPDPPVPKLDSTITRSEDR